MALLRSDPREAGFSLIDIVIATAIFIVLSLVAFEVVRALGANVTLLAQHRLERAESRTLAETLRTDAAAAVAIWKPTDTCGDAVALLERDAAGSAFVVFVLRSGQIVRITGPGPLDPCAAADALHVLVHTATSFGVAPVTADALAAHRDPVTTNVDGGALLANGITRVAVASGATDTTGSAILSGNDVVEVTYDAEPARGVVDLVAGNRPSGFTAQLNYACGGRCAATSEFPETRNGDYTSCTATPEFGNDPTHYVPAAYAQVPDGSGGFVAVITSYAIVGDYDFSFSGQNAVDVRRDWPLSTWPAPAHAPIQDPYPLNYAANSLQARFAAAGAAGIAADIGMPATFATPLSICAQVQSQYHG